METTQPRYRPAKRREPKTGVDPKTKTVGVSEDAFNQIEAQAKKLKMSKSKYASAAIAFFAESGLDPTKERPVGLAGVGSKVDKETLAIRQQNVDIGNRLIAIIRGWEKNLYTFMQQQQQTTYGYLEQIEGNILQHQVTVETNLLAPMVEHLFKSNIEAFITRGLASQLFLKAFNQPAESYPKQLAVSNDERDTQLANQMREFLKTNSVPVPKLTPRRAVTPVPAKPVAPASPAPATPPKS
jgi:hypothetical protein